MEKDQPMKKGSMISAMFLVAGCCIGGGMLALPVASGPGGFLPSVVIMTLCWFCMTASALLLMEVCLWMKGEGAHFITMTSQILGPIGKAIAWVLFLYISYASLVAYAAGGGVLMSSFVTNYLGVELSKDVSAALITIFFTSVIAFGGKFVGRVNSLFFIALIGAYLCLVLLGTGEVKTSYLFQYNWSYAWVSIPLLLTAFSFQTMVPSLAPILQRHTNALRLTIVGGTTIAFVVYLVWQFIIVGIIPIDGPHGLIQANLQSVPSTQFLGQHVNAKVFVYVAEFFGFFALVTSYLAIGLGLFDFLSDGLKIKETFLGSIILALLIMVPTIVCAIKFERAFMIALDTSGGFGDTILNGMIPVLMVWIGRYKLGYTNGFKVPGGKPLLVFVFCFFLGSLILEILMQTGVVKAGYEAYQLLDDLLINEI